MTKDYRTLQKNARLAAHSLKALAHEIRLMAICTIGDGERTVQQLELALGTTQSNISQHLTKMKDRGILDSRRQGNRVFYKIADPKIVKLIKALQQTYC